MFHSKEEVQELRENALHDQENMIWRSDQKNPISVVEEMVSWEQNGTFDELETWPSEEIDKIAEAVDDLGIWLAKKVNPYSSEFWVDLFESMIKSGRTAKITAAYLLCKKDAVCKNTIGLFTKARAELELQALETVLEKDYG